MKRTLCLLLVFLNILFCAACSPAASAPAEKETAVEAIQPEGSFCFTDDLGREVCVGKVERVAVMIGSFADVWCLAGGRDTIVAAADDTWTSFDLGLDESVANLGAIKAPSLETLLASEPELVIASCNTTSNLELKDILEEAGITVVYFDVQCFGDYLRMLDICTSITGCRENYEIYGTAVEQQVNAALKKQDGSAPTVLCLRATGSSCTVKKSSDNLLGEMLCDLGCINVADGGSTALEELSMEAIMVADPDYIFAVLQGSDSTPAMETLKTTLLSNPAWESLRAVREGRFYMLENSLFNLKPNAKWGNSYEKLAEILYPSVG